MPFRRALAFRPRASRFTAANASTLPWVPRRRVARAAAVAIALVVVALAPRPAAAQTSGDLGVTFTPAFFHYLDINVDPVCCPASVWGAVGSGRWRAHVDYLRSTHEGETVHETNVLAAWRFREGDGARAALLFGAHMRRRLWYQVGAALDWPVGHRFFVRVDARLILFRVGIGAGIGF